MTKFFEVTSVSATHIYHSALELSPLSSVVRRLYHHRRISPSARVVIGTPDSWNPSIVIPNQDHPYESCTWSPCGQFIAAQTQEIVEVRDPLTSELLSTYQHTKPNHQLIGPLAYSPDGRSICCVSDTNIIIWDIQTGGVANEIECDDILGSLISLVWSLDGRSIGVVLIGDNTSWTVVKYDVSSGGALRHTLCSADKPHLWAHDKFFQVLTTTRNWRGELASNKAYTLDIFEVGPALTQVKSFHISEAWGFIIKSFSPISHHVSMVSYERLLIIGNQSLVHSLDAKEVSGFHCFSPDGNLFAASFQEGVHVWKYTRGDPSPDYTPWREFSYHGWPPDNPRLQFSPTSSSISGHFTDVLQVWRLDDPPAVPIASREQYTIFSPQGAYIVTAQPRGGTVTITNPIPQTSPRFIDTGTTILGLALTGDILWVVGSETIVAWRLTEEGVVDGVFNNRRASPSDRIWTISPIGGPPSPKFSVEGRVGFVALNKVFIYTFHARTGEGVMSTSEQPPSRWYNLEDTSRGRYHLRYDKPSWHDGPSEDTRPISQTTLREGWMDGPEGKHMLWLPVEWRTRGGYAKWFHGIATLQLELPGEELIVVSSGWNPPLLRSLDDVQNESHSRSLVRSTAASL